MDEPTYKAAQLYRERCKRLGLAAEPIGERSGVSDVAGRRYVVLKSDAEEILEIYSCAGGKVYRIGPANWPAGID